VEEIVPEIDRIVLLQRGRIVGDGPKRATLTAERMSALFEYPLKLHQTNGHYSVQPTR
jgi:iron complex transport system ATP-binding protein